MKKLLLCMLCALAMVAPFFTDTAAAKEETSEQLTNIALDKSVRAAQGQANLITNGDKSDYWDGGVGPQSFVIDLEDYYTLIRKTCMRMRFSKSI